MRTVRTKVYKFSELSEQAQQKAIDNYRNSGRVETGYYWDEAHDSVKKFHNIFGTKEGNRSWLEFKTDHIDDNILNLKGLRLRTYIINNFWDDIHNGKYFSLWSKTETSYQYHKEGHPVLKSRNSKVLFTRDCPLTGVCWDNSILQPIYDFIDWKLRPDYNSYMDFETLIGDCLSNLQKDLEREDEYRNSDEAIREELENSEREYTKDGNLF